MPTYQYRCQACSHDLEAFQKFTDDALTECPECGGSLRKVFSAVGIVFKGSGFYATDSRKSHKKAKTSDSKAPEPSAAASTTPDTSSPSANASTSGSGANSSDAA